MPRSFVIRIVVVVVAVVLVLVALSMIDASRTPKQVVKVVPDNALAR